MTSATTSRSVGGSKSVCCSNVFQNDRVSSSQSSIFRSLKEVRKGFKTLIALRCRGVGGRRRSREPPERSGGGRAVA